MTMSSRKDETEKAAIPCAQKAYISIFFVLCIGFTVLLTSSVRFVPSLQSGVSTDERAAPSTGNSSGNATVETSMKLDPTPDSCHAMIEREMEEYFRPDILTINIFRYVNRSVLYGDCDMTYRIHSKSAFFEKFVHNRNIFEVVDAFKLSLTRSLELDAHVDTEYTIINRFCQVIREIL